jgi:hypothetical protein
MQVMPTQTQGLLNQFQREEAELKRYLEGIIESIDQSSREELAEGSNGKTINMYHDVYKRMTGTLSVNSSIEPLQAPAWVANIASVRSWLLSSDYWSPFLQMPGIRSRTRTRQLSIFSCLSQTS